MKELKKKVSISIDNDVLDQIKALSETYNRPLSQFINLILIDYLNPETYSDELKKIVKGK